MTVNVELLDKKHLLYTKTNLKIILKILLMKRGKMMLNIDNDIEYIDNRLEEIVVLNNAEYLITQDLVKVKYKKQLYNELIYKGLIQYFCILSLKEIRNVLYSIKMREKVICMENDKLKPLLFQPYFFEKNMLYQLNYSWNKILTLLKFRFNKSDNHFSTSYARLSKILKEDKEYINHEVKDKINKIVGSKQYRNFKKLREETEHGLEPMYRDDLHKIFKVDDMLYLSRKYIEVIDGIFDEHLVYVPKIDEKDIDKYKMKEFNIVDIKHINKVNIHADMKDYYIRIEKLVNFTQNFFDLMIPYLKKIELHRDVMSMINLLFTIISDIVFRINDVFRAYGYCISIYTEDFISKEIENFFKDVNYDYFMNIACVRCYSIYDKVGLLITRLFPMPKDKTYFKSSIKWMSENLKEEYLDAISVCNSILNSKEYEILDFIRQQYVHGVDVSVKQYEGEQFSDEDIMIILHHNIDMILCLVEKFCNDIFINEINKVIKKIYIKYPKGYKKVINDVKKSYNKYFSEENEKVTKGLDDLKIKRYIKPSQKV